MLEQKDYTNWHKVKTMEHNGSLNKNRGLNYREGQIYWASIGQNIGYEEDGKGASFGRPVLIIKGYNRQMFLGVPLTSKYKTGSFYHSFRMNGANKPSTALLSQLRTFDTARIYDRHPLGSVSGNILKEIKYLLREMIGN